MRDLKKQANSPAPSPGDFGIMSPHTMGWPGWRLIHVIRWIQIWCQGFIPVSIPKRVLSLGLLLPLSVALSSCLDYRITINFPSQTGGTIVQHLHINDRLATLGSVTLEDWFTALSIKNNALQGFSRRLSPQDLELTLPFTNGQDLVSKFNRLFAPPDPNSPPLPLPISAHLDLQQKNLLLVLRNHLDLTVDLRQLGITSATGEPLLDTGSLLTMALELQLPWGGQWHLANADHPNAQAPIQRLQPGELNQLEATFWIPSPIGLGALAIVLLVTIGTQFRSRPSAPQP